MSDQILPFYCSLYLAKLFWEALFYGAVLFDITVQELVHNVHDLF